MAKPTQKTTVAIKKAPQDKPRQTTVYKNDTIQPKATSTHHSAKEKQIASITKNGASDEQNKWVMEIYRTCGYELDAVLMVEGESGFVLNAYNKNKNGSYDTGLFQLNSTFHKPFIRSPQFKDPYEQIKYGCEVWKKAKNKSPKLSPWYAYRNIVNNPKARKDITARFTINYK